MILSDIALLGVTFIDMRGFTKLFGSIINSTIWREDDKTRLVWITMLAMAGRDGVVESSLPGLADAARVSIKECEAALVVLKSPDPYSRTKEHEGRRVEVCDGGWLILNHAKYRAKMTLEDRRERAALRQAKFRERRQTLREQVQAQVATDPISLADQRSLRALRRKREPNGSTKAEREYDLESCTAGNTPAADPAAGGIRPDHDPGP